VARSVEYVQSGTTALADAKMLQKKTRKWMCCAIILLLVTAAVIVIVVSGFVVWCRLTQHHMTGG
jgi:syntaxin 1B/2/3